MLSIILGSDKAQLTALHGDQEVWPVYLSLGCISKELRIGCRTDAWVLIAYIPVVNFEEKKLNGVLKSRYFHQCLRLILSPLREAGVHGVEMKDSLGDVRLFFPRLAAYLSDYPEQILIACAGVNSSPTSTARFHQLGNSQPSPPRTYAFITGILEQLRAEVDPNNVADFLKALQHFGFNGVAHPFWEDFPGVEPDLMIPPDILHGLYRLFRDHLLK